MRNYSKALNYYNKELNLKLKFVNQNHPILSSSYNNIGLVYLDTSAYQKALKNFKKALYLQEKFLKFSNAIISKSYYNISMTYRGINNYQKAYIYAKRAFDSFSINRTKGFMILDNFQKLEYLKSTKMYLSELMKNTYLLNHKRDKYVTLNRWLNYKRIIFDYENSLNILNQRTTDQNIKNKINRLLNYQKSLAKVHQNISNEKKIKELQTKISKLEIELNSFQQNNITYQNISRQLKVNELYIDFVKTENRYYLFALDKKENIQFKYINAIQTKEIDKYIQRIIEDLNKAP
jgi:tetratricopeptide (TPR) repeat protein